MIFEVEVSVVYDPKTSSIQVFTLYVDLSEQQEPTRCLIALEAELSPFELDADDVEFNWYLVSSTGSDSSKENDLEDFLSEQTASTLAITYEYIEPEAEYSFGVWYRSSVGQNVSNTIDLSTSIPSLAEVNIDGGLE